MEKIAPYSLEISHIDCRYHDLKIPNQRRQGEVLASVGERGVLEALSGIMINGTFILIDGFKRLHACKKLNIFTVEVDEWTMDEASALLRMLKLSSTKSLHIFEEARIVERLCNEHHLSCREIANKLNRSSAWVSVRTTFLRKTSHFVLEQVFSGRFPASGAAYTLRQFRRISNIEDSEIDAFVKATSGKNLSVRDIDLLAKRYFSGDEEAKKNITEGRLDHLLSLRKRSDVPVSNFERDLLNDLEMTHKYIGRLFLKLPQCQLSSSNFNSMAATILEGISGKCSRFSMMIQQALQRLKNDQ
jgi:hypothetical protein